MVARVLDPHHSTGKWTIHCNQPVAASPVAPRDVLKLVFHEGPCPPPVPLYLGKWHRGHRLSWEMAYFNRDPHYLISSASIELH
jgi:hypothetical protein